MKNNRMKDHTIASMAIRAALSQCPNEYFRWNRERGDGVKLHNLNDNKFIIEVVLMDSNHKVIDCCDYIPVDKKNYNESTWCSLFSFYEINEH